MKKLFLLLFLAAPSDVKADINHSITSSVKLQVDAPATQTTRLGTRYSVTVKGLY